jgi:hypothetical protein
MGTLAQAGSHSGSAAGTAGSIENRMRRELRPTHEAVACDVCGRTILKGERAEPYLAPGGQRRLVCDLCIDRAYHEGWIRESAHNELPASARRTEPRRSLWSRVRRRQEERAAAHWDDAPSAGGEPSEVEPPPPAPAAGPPPAREAWDGGGRDPRQVRAIPTTAQVKIERALELFNSSEHTRTIAGIARTLGQPWVSAVPLADAPSEVAVAVAWELSWYRFRIDLGDEEDPVTLIAKGEELGELDDGLRQWNASADAEGRLLVG